MTQPTPDPELALGAIVDSAHPLKIATAEWARATIDPGDMVARDR